VNGAGRSHLSGRGQMHEAVALIIRRARKRKLLTQPCSSKI
jgi:hypothetical protein